MRLTLLIIEILILIGFSAVCSGLNIALMSLELADLRRKAKLKNKLARKVLPLRKNAHLSLAAILLTNVAAVSATSLVLEHEFNGLIAGIASTLLIVIFGEIFPQALFTRNALLFCYRLAPVLQFMIFITYPIAKPLQLLLDRLFGIETTRLQSRRELGILIGEHAQMRESELDEDEIEIMKGALSLSEKRVRDIMTPIDKTYWLTPGTELTGEKIDEIKAVGRSRIPIFNSQLTKCYGLLLMKDLVDVDFDERTFHVDEMPIYPCQIVGGMTALDTMFRKFISAGTHLIPVEREDHIVGIITIEDLLEEIVGHEIEDETDRFKAKFRRRNRLEA